MSIQNRFTEKSVLITGSATGIGRATALAFAAEGALLTLADVDPRAGEVAAEITENGGTATFISTNVTDPHQMAAAVVAAVQAHGRVDVAFNNAGILPPTAELVDQDLAEFDRIIAVDLRGVFVAMQYEIRQMLTQGGGAIINTASVAGLIADPGMSSYVAAKHGVVGLTKAAGIEYAARGIRVNAIAPGLTHTPMTQRWLDDPEMSKIVLANTPIGRPAQPDEIAGMVLFLASEAASFAAGQVFTLDGGQTAH